MFETAVPLLDTIIASVFFILIFAIFHSGIMEFLQTQLRSRNQFLKEMIDRLLADPRNLNYAERLYNHPLVKSTKPRASGFPAYLDGRLFAQALSGVFQQLGTDKDLQFDPQHGSFVYQENPISGTSPFEEVKAGIAAMQPSGLKDILDPFVREAGSLAEFQQKLQIWFDMYMDRTSGQYKRRIFLMDFIVAFLIVLSFNLNLLSAVQQFRNDEVLRDHTMSQAVGFYQAESAKPVFTRIDSMPIDSLRMHLKCVYKEAEKAKLPFGWEIEPDAPMSIFSEKNLRGGIFKTLIGWILMTFAISFGSSQWFRILGAFINLRTSVKPISSTQNSAKS